MLSKIELGNGPEETAVPAGHVGPRSATECAIAPTQKGDHRHISADSTKQVIGFGRIEIVTRSPERECGSSSAKAGRAKF
jgi:hypothetical protein